MLPFLSGHASFFENLCLIFCSAFDKLREEMSKLTFVIISIVKMNLEMKYSMEETNNLQ